MTNCAVMGCDWRALTWWEYTARLHAWNDAHDPDAGKPVADAARLKRLMAEH